CAVMKTTTTLRNSEEDVEDDTDCVSCEEYDLDDADWKIIKTA
ncbi:hypothetical protein A2U01_0118586, partial [Trifolium medium]|nr:hypothetical protein [Trifolium medium]